MFIKKLNLNFSKINNFLSYNKYSFSTGHESMPQKLKRKFYKTVEVLEVENQNFDKSTFIKNSSLDNNVFSLEKFTNLSKLGKFYYQILLDKKTCKTMYLDEFIIPNKNLAYMIAEEWAKQEEVINLHSMHLNFYASSGIRISKDPSLREEISTSFTSYVESDQICFMEDKIINFIHKEENENLNESMLKISSYMETNFGVKLKRENILTTGFNFSNVGENIKNFSKIINQFDPWVISLIEQLVGLTKSPAISMALLNNLITPTQAYLLSHSEEYYQMKKNGEVEGSHDIAYEMIMGKLHSILCFNNIFNI